MLEPGIFKSALVAYAHYLCIFLCFSALMYERLRLKVDLNRGEAISIILADIVYGLAGLMIILTGILRVRYFGQGAEFYTQNPLFWLKVGAYIAVGLLSLYPTISYILWAIPLSKNNLPNLSPDLVSRFRLIINIELLGFSLIPLLATFMARGIGL
ncbi:hypothetical protein EV04_1177 [Prochlorococcus marinus str. LG]|nr:hypothetical protein EV04_1177 [Prochlorococcus marinus str. LG]